ncbi:MAG: hypothetical protein V5A45_09140 [Haloarculaceae archaeon]
MTESDQSETTDVESGEQNETSAAPPETSGLEQVTQTPSDEPAARKPDDAGRARDESSDDTVISDGMRRYLYRGSFVALALFGLFAAVQFYINASQTISVWIAPDYRPLFQAVFNLVVVLACALGLTVLVERFH